MAMLYCGMTSKPEILMSPLGLPRISSSGTLHFSGTRRCDGNWTRPPTPSYTRDLRSVYEGRVPGGADLVTYWFEKARTQIASGEAKRAGLLATNSIRMVGNRPILERIKNSGDIFTAWSDRPWTLDGAAVRVSIVGFDDGSEKTRTLDGKSVIQIHADLTAEANVATATSLKENAELCFLGIMKGGAIRYHRRRGSQDAISTIEPE